MEARFVSGVIRGAAARPGEGSEEAGSAAVEGEAGVD